MTKHEYDIMKDKCGLLQQAIDQLRIIAKHEQHAITHEKAISVYYAKALNALIYDLNHFELQCKRYEAIGK